MTNTHDMKHLSPDRLEQPHKTGRPTKQGIVAGVDYIGVGVGAMVFDDSSNLFLAQRGPGARNERNHWEFPGGAVQLNERLADAIKREFLEEFGMVIEPRTLLCVTDHILPAENQHWVSACFIARHLSGQPTVREADKCLAFCWSKLNELPDPLTVISSSFLRAFQDALAIETNIAVGQSLTRPIVKAVLPDDGMLHNVSK